MSGKYPYWKVIIGFILCPGIAGALSGIVMVFSALMREQGNTKLNGIIDYLGVLLLTPLVTGLTGLLFFCVPALIASLIYAALRLHKGWLAYAFVALLGGCAAHFWVPVIWGAHYNNWTAFDLLNIYFALGASSSLLMALIVLPRKKTR